MPEALAKPRLLSRAEYDELVERGEFDDQRVELIRGRIVEMSPQGPPHSSATAELTEFLILAVGDRAKVRSQLPLAISDDSEPEPDIAIVARGRYKSEHPTTALLVIEVASTSLEKDRGEKMHLYAAEGIPEYWIVDVVEETVEVYLDPQGREYRSMVTRTSGDTLRPTKLPGLEIAVDAIF